MYTAVKSTNVDRSAGQKGCQNRGTALSTEALALLALRTADDHVGVAQLAGRLRKKPRGVRASGWTDGALDAPQL